MPKRTRDEWSQAPAAPTVATTLASSSLLDAWREQLTLHSASSEPVWVQSPRRGTLVGETLALLDERLIYAIAGVELWAQRRPASSAMHLHFDVDEEHARHTSADEPLRCPATSVILYISDAGGPTLLLEQRPRDAWRASVSCHACWPRAGQLMAFPGDWLHGVVPADGASATEERVTVVLNLWARKPLGVPALRARDVPKASEAPPRARSPPRERDWAEADDAWRWRSLSVGMRDRTSTAELLMPPLVSSGAAMERFTARCRVQKDS